MAESPVAKERDLRDGMRFGCESTIRTMAKNSSNFLRGSRTGFLRGSRTGPKTLSRQAEFSLCAAPACRPEHTYGRAGGPRTPTLRKYNVCAGGKSAAGAAPLKKGPRPQARLTAAAASVIMSASIPDGHNTRTGRNWRTRGRRG